VAKDGVGVGGVGGDSEPVQYIEQRVGPGEFGIKIWKGEGSRCEQSYFKGIV
jgi:hypothetical protein